MARSVTARSLYEALRERLAGLCLKGASVHEKRSDYAAALDRLRDGLDVLEGQETLETALIYLARAGIHHRQGDKIEHRGSAPCRQNDQA